MTELGDERAKGLTASARVLKIVEQYLQGSPENAARLRAAIERLDGDESDMVRDARRHTAAHLAVELLKESGIPRRAEDGNGGSVIGQAVATAAREIEHYLREG